MELSGDNSLQTQALFRTSWTRTISWNSQQASCAECNQVNHAAGIGLWERGRGQARKAQIHKVFLDPSQESRDTTASRWDAGATVSAPPNTYHMRTACILWYAPLPSQLLQMFPGHKSRISKDLQSCPIPRNTVPLVACFEFLLYFSVPLHVTSEGTLSLWIRTKVKLPFQVAS